MDRWQTTVRGDTWKEIQEAARAAVYNFFEDETNRQKVLEAMRFDIQPNEIVVARDHRGNITHQRIDSYEAVVSVGF